MAQPLYFLPNVNIESQFGAMLLRPILKERGLAEIFADVADDKMAGHTLAGRGPGNHAGTIVFYQTPKGDVPRRVIYKAEEQEWTPIGDGSKLWIGVDTADPPNPADLIRRRTYPGYAAELADCNRWNLPIVRRPGDNETSLPRDMFYENGVLKQPIKAAFAKHWEDSAEVADFIFNGLPMSVTRGFDLAVQFLGINYRYGMNEQFVLRLIDSDNWMPVIMASIDYEMAKALPEFQKKSERRQVDSSST